MLHTSRFNRDKIGKSRFFQNADSNRDFYPKNRRKFFLTIFIEKIAIFKEKIAGGAGSGGFICKIDFLFIHSAVRRGGEGGEGEEGRERVAVACGSRF